MNLRTAAIDFVAAQNTADRQELLFRAHRHASTLTGQLPVPVAQRVVQSFVAAVNREFLAVGQGLNFKKKENPVACTCGGRNQYNKDCPVCGDEARKKASIRTAALADFPDELMF